MGRENREMPQGYKHVNLASINASGVMPETWFFRKEPLPGIRAFFMTRELIRKGEIFMTGLSINTIPNVFRIASTTPSEFAQKFIKNLKMERVSNLEEDHTDSLVTFRQKFTMTDGVVDGYLMEPTSFYYSITGNDKRNIAYIAMFETPTDKWSTDEEIANIMIKGLVFDSRTR